MAPCLDHWACPLATCVPHTAVDHLRGTDTHGPGLGGGTCPARGHTRGRALTREATLAPQLRVPANAELVPVAWEVAEERDHALRPWGFTTAGRAAPVKGKVGDPLETKALSKVQPVLTASLRGLQWQRCKACVWAVARGRW